MAEQTKNNSSQGDFNNDVSIQFGKLLTHPDPGDEIVISGLSGKYPESKDVHQFRENLFNKIDMITDDNRRWEPGHPEIPHRTGKVPDVDKFDAGYFGVHQRQATSIDPMLRLFLEEVTNALFDAGINPSDLEGTNTGVFMSACISETEKTFYFDKLVPQGYAVTGCQRSMQAHRVSYFLKLKGPSFNSDTACSSSLYAFEQAYRAIRTGQCDRAIVGGANLCLHPFLSLQFARLGVLSMDGKCKVFDKAGNGYVRSEAVSAVILQKSKEAKRIYATVLHAKTNCDGYKDMGITFPSKDMQLRLLNEFYEECDIVKPSDLSFLEAHGTGTNVGDPEELLAIENIFLRERDTPLLIGSVKSNIGHTEPPSGLCSITKAIIALETGYIPPNIHYSTPRAGIKSLENGQLQVVTEKMPFNDNRGLIGINSFGFGGANCHVLLKHNPKEKIKHDISKGNIPRLVCVSGRTREAVHILLDDVVENHADPEHIRLLQEVCRKNVIGHLYRGYSLVTESEEISRSCSLNSGNVSTLVICFGVIDEKIRKRVKEFLHVPIVAETIKRIHEVLLSKGLNILNILSATEINAIETVLANFTLLIIFADILKALMIVPDKIFGITKEVSLGTLACAYFDGALGLREVLECAYVIANAVNLASSADSSNRKELNVLLEKYGNVATSLQQALNKILAKPKMLSSKVIFEVTPSEISSVYLIDSIGSTKVLDKVRTTIKKNCVFFEVGNGYINKSFKEKPGYWHRSFVSTSEGLNGFLMSLGRLYELGYNPQIQNLFPKIDFPLSRGTPMISPKIKWNHNRQWFVTHYKWEDEMRLEGRNIGIVTQDPNFSFVEGHVIDGRTLFPATGYLKLVWDTVSHIYGFLSDDMKIVFENCKFKRACSVPRKLNQLNLTVTVQRVSGNFVITEGNEAVVTGRITQISKNETELDSISLPTKGNKAPLMTNKDVYKELRLRGYNYMGQFKKLHSCDISAQEGKIPWDGNWVSFMDNMLQISILQEDTRLLYVPTTIRRLTIDAKAHIEYAQNFVNENSDLPVYASKEMGIIRSGYIEIRGLNASCISRRKYLGTPVLEKNVFVPNITKLKTEQAVRVNMQILLENLYSIKIKVVEVTANSMSEELEPLGPLIQKVLEDQPLIQPNIISYKIELEPKNFKVEDKQLLTEVDCSLVTGFRIFQREDVLNLVCGLLKENGFILSREPLDFDSTSCSNKGMTIITEFTTDKEKLVFCRKNKQTETPTVVRVSIKDKQFSWLPRLKDAVGTNRAVLVYAQGEPLNGVLGLIACVRREPGGQNVKLVFLPDSCAPKFDLEMPFYQEQLKKNLAINVLKDSRWGTYRHLLLEDSDQIEVEHCYLNSLTRGDLSSLKWIEGPLKPNTPVENDHTMVSVYYAAINFRDVMIATGKISVDSITRDRRKQECTQGFEYSGRTQDGKRVMGMMVSGATASLLKADKQLLWGVPDEWSLEDAVTVPVVYATCLVALSMTANMQRGNTVLIHSGTGGIGQAAITLALHAGCTVYTTVGSLEKREFLKKQFPQLTDLNIANSRDTSFEKHIMNVTNGRGVDIVLNSLAEEKLLASVRCVAKGGNFLEIGKFDLANDNTLNLLLLEKEVTFHGIMLDRFYEDPETKLILSNILKEGLQNGAVKPLSRVVFNTNDTEKAFRYMSSGKHIGKVILKLREAEKENVIKPSRLTFPAIPRYCCDNNKTYIICGGLGGFGLELADWLVSRGCMKLVLNSRNGIKTGYQAYRISIWRSYGCIISISTDDITTEEGCLNLFKAANKLGPVHAIFNLAVVLKDALLENQTEESYNISFGPKAYATEHLDFVSRKSCPELRDFVVFSSVSCGRGNAGQSNYGMSNSVMERICEKRKKEGFPAVAIEWGAVGDVGLVADMQDKAIEIEIGGTLQQRITNCLQCMDILLRQNEAAIVSSIVVAEKRAGAGEAENIVDAVANILGIKDLKAISLQATLAEVGMDSMTAVEIKQTLEREYEVYLTAQDIKTMTFAKLITIQAEKEAEDESDNKKERALIGMDMVYRRMADASIVNIPIFPIKGKMSDKPSLSRLVLFPGLEGVATSLEPLYKHLEADLVALQYPNDTQKDTIEDMANTYLPLIEEQIEKSEPFKIVSYSFGGIVALEAVHRLEEKGYKGTLICIDTSPDYLKSLSQILELTNDDKFQISLLVSLMSFQVSYEEISKHLETLIKCDDFEARIKVAQSIVGPNSLHTPEHQRACAVSLYKRLKALVNWNPEFKLKSKVVLFKPTLVSIHLPDEDYGLSKICEHPVEVKVFNGNHVTILENPEVPNEMAEQSKNNSSQIDSNNDLSIQFGKLLTHPNPGDEVVISGLSGKYPESKDVHQFQDNLFNKVDMISDDNRRWEPGHPEIPHRTGKVPDVEKFDAGYFGVHKRQATCMDPMIRLLLEEVIKALFDAGINPSDLEGTNTGVFMSACISETEKAFYYDTLVPQGYAVMGCQRSLQAHRVSYFLKLKGLSFNSDTACSSSLHAFEQAYKAIRTGQCDRAIVGGSNLCLHPYLTLQFARLGVLSMDGKCKVFDNAGNGYVRSEAVSALILQKSKEAKRMYATVLHAKTNCDGYKDMGITFPSKDMQFRLLNEFYEECDIKPSDLSFLDAHGTGTIVGDPEELHAIEKIFLKGRNSPLLIGSVKSNIGHTEPPSGLCSITKAIIALETGYIPPNINFRTPRAGIKSLENGQLQVVTEKMPFNDNRGLIGISSFGFGGANCHVLLKHNPKEKVKHEKSKDNIPRLVCVSGRTREAVHILLDDVIENHADPEHTGLLQEVFRKNVMGHLYRGYSLTTESKEISRSCNFNSGNVSTLVICFGVIDEEIRKGVIDFFQVPVVAESIKRIQEVLLSKGLNISKILSATETNTIERVLANFILLIIIADILNALMIVPDKIFGVTKELSLGTLACAYFDGALDLREVLECAYVIANAVNLASSADSSNRKELNVLIEKNGNVGTYLQQALKGILPKPKMLSSKVIFELTPSEMSSVYLIDSIGSTKVLDKVRTSIKDNCVLFEVGNGYINNSFKENPSCWHNKSFVSTSGGLNGFLKSLGRLYELGYNPQIQNLFPKIKFPVSKGTPMISPKIQWNHSRQWWVTHYKWENTMILEGRNVLIYTHNPTFNFIEGHVIDGRTLFPATGYLKLVWDTLSDIHGFLPDNMKIVFENCKFKRACSVPKKNNQLYLTVVVQRVSGNFVITEGNEAVVTGRITQFNNSETELAPFPLENHEGPLMTNKDVYKELRLRGYNYKGEFRKLHSCDISAQEGKITWDGNWVSFMDNMLQIKILQEDTRFLYVPTTIRKLTIDAQAHIEYAQNFKKLNSDLPVYASTEKGIIRSGFIEIRGLNASPIARRKYLGTPVLEKYVFVPNISELKTEQAVRVNMQILLENLYSTRIKVVELISNVMSEDSELLGPHIKKVLEDQPLIQPNIISYKIELEPRNLKLEDKQLLTEVDCSLVTGSKIFQREDVLNLVCGLLKENGFILSREPLDFDSTSCSNQGVSVITEFTTDKEKLVLARKNKQFETPLVIKVSSKDNHFTWLPLLKDAVGKDRAVLVYAQDEPLNGVLGLVACVRREPGGQNVKLVFIPDSSSPKFDLEMPFYQEQLKKNLAINVLKDGYWGTYRHLLLEHSDQIKVEHCYLNAVIKGDLSSLKWIEGSLSSDSPEENNNTIVSVYYAALNFRDVMTASGKINASAVTRDRRQQECIQGIEFSGRTQDGRKVMGMTVSGGSASIVKTDKRILWDVPDEWSLEDAATVPVVYATCLYAFFMRANLRYGNTVLIHSGTGGIGQAAITLALNAGCTVYTTVGSLEKREFLKKQFPQLADLNIANSRDTSFEKHIMKVTNGRGVDIVLNSLAEEKLLASVRCVAKGGCFLEIGKFDLASDNTLNLLLLQKEVTFHGVMLDRFLNGDISIKPIFDTLQQGIQNGSVKPLSRTVFTAEQTEKAFRYMSSGKHIGKVVLKLREEEKENVIKPNRLELSAIPRYCCDDQKTYVICGGLGGFGLELADWLVLRGCTKLVLTSRNGIKTGYQAYRISIWRSYGCIISISTDDITTEEGCLSLIKTANKLGPVHAIFNLAVVLKDALLENQTEEFFKISFGPKAYATKHLDLVSRKWCPELRDFVIFSSVSCGRGNAGQSNYGMANSIMERICEKRKKDGFPAVAIEWGAVGDVGLVAEMQDEAIEMEIGGTLQQRITNCLECMDILLRQNEAAIVSSIVVAEKKAGTDGAENIVDAAANILGIKDLKSISLHATLAEVGMDSMTAVEIKQTLEREFEVYLTAQDVKSMTFAKLIAIQAEKEAEHESGNKKERALIGMDMIYRQMADASIINIPIVSIKGNISDKASLSTLVLFPGIEGVASLLEPLYKHLKADLVGLQYPNNTQKDTIEGMANTYLPLIEERIEKTEPFKIICYSFGGTVALEAVHRLEEKGYTGTVICIDTSPDYLKSLTNMLEISTDDKFQVSLLVFLMSFQLSYDVISKHLETLIKCDDFEARIKVAQNIVGPNSLHTPEHLKACALSVYKRLKAIINWNPEFKLKSKVVLFKPTLVSINLPDEDYGLSKICEHPVDVKVFDGNHVTILENPEMSKEINTILERI